MITWVITIPILTCELTVSLLTNVVTHTISLLLKFNIAIHQNTIHGTVDHHGINGAHVIHK